MKLYLSSYMIGDHPEQLVKMVGGTGARMAIVTNALDCISLEDQFAYARTQFDAVDYFARYGFDPSLVDLRFYFGRPEALRDMLRRYKVIWTLGGNAFLLRRAMRQSGFDVMIAGLLNAGMVYSGWSAGACVAGTSLKAVALMDNPSQAAPGYPDDEPIWEGLGLVPFEVIPHYDSDHPEKDAAAAAIAWADAHGVEYRALRDGDVIVADDGPPQILHHV